MPLRAREIGDYPPRMLASEVCEVARLSRKMLQQQIKDGRLNLAPAGRGLRGEQVFLREDVAKALGLAIQSPGRTAPERPRVSVDKIRARQQADRSRPK